MMTWWIRLPFHLPSGHNQITEEIEKFKVTFPDSRFKNVMVFDAPLWSPASVHFMLGFPRRLIEAAHGGLLPGNIIISHCQG